MPDLSGLDGSKPSQKPCADRLGSIGDWIALHSPWVNCIDANKEDRGPQDCKDGSCGVGLNAVNEGHVLCLSPLIRTTT